MRSKPNLFLTLISGVRTIKALPGDDVVKTICKIRYRFDLDLIWSFFYEKPKQIWQTSGFVGFRFSQDGDVPGCRDHLLSDQRTVTKVVGRLWQWSKIESWWHDQNMFWSTNSDSGSPSKLSESENVVTVVSNRKLVTLLEYVLWSSDEPKITEAFLPSCWNQMIADITLARLWQWPSDQTCRLDQNIFFDHLTYGQRLKLFQPENWWCDMSLSRYRPYVSMRDVQMTNDK